MLVIRLFRVGKKNQSVFKIVVTDKRRPPRGGRFLEQVGFYNPLTKEKNLKEERIKYWLSVGAKPSDTIHNLLIKEKVIEGNKIPVHKKTKKKEEKTEEKPTLTDTSKDNEEKSSSEVKKETKEEKSIETKEEKSEEKPISDTEDKGKTEKSEEKKPVSEKPSEESSSKEETKKENQLKEENPKPDSTETIENKTEPLKE